MPEKHYRNCNLCEAICGVEITHEHGKILKIEGDKADTFSRGHICPKAVALQDVYEDQNRLRKPVRRTADGWDEISWSEAFDTVAERILDIQNHFGRDAIAVFQGNPSVHNLGTMLNSRELLKSLKTKNNYSATSVDQLPHHFASWAMLGHQFLIPIPDIDHTDLFLILGGNPLASNGSLMTSPDVKNRLDAIKKRGKVMVIDPRKTETANFASEHFFIKPATDAYLLLAIVNTLFRENLVDLGKLAAFTDGVEILRDVSNEWTAEKAETFTGIPATEIGRITREFAASKTAVCYGRMGVSVQKFGGLCQWLINAVNIITGNLDRKGGAMFTSPAIDLLQTSKGGEIFGRWQSRFRKLSEFMGELPVSALAEEILTTGEGQIKALITSCGNPVLSTPNGSQLDKGLAQLDFMVSIDFYINETTRHADMILPPVSNLESSHYDIIFNSLAVRNTAKYSEALFEKPDGTKYDWEIFQELVWRLNGKQGEFKCEPPEVKLNLGLMFGKYQLSLETLKQNPHGVDLGELKESLPARLMTANKRINLVPQVFVKDLERLKSEANRSEVDGFRFRLIGRRSLRDDNSWLHNSERLMKGKNRCTAWVNREDAKELNLENHEVIKVSSRAGVVEIPCEITEDIARGVVSIPHGYGHGKLGVRLDIANKYAGVSINDLTDELEIDELTGNAGLNGVRVTVQSVNNHKQD